MDLLLELLLELPLELLLVLLLLLLLYVLHHVDIGGREAPLLQSAASAEGGPACGISLYSSGSRWVLALLGALRVPPFSFKSLHRTITPDIFFDFLAFQTML